MAAERALEYMDLVPGTPLPAPQPVFPRHEEPAED